jgi:thiamine phosphate synthase YjbQ (UPF0047 family)
MEPTCICIREVDFNGYAHVRAAFMPTSVVIPIQDGQLVLGTHQEIQVVDNQPEELPLRTSYKSLK